jgi:hypothetical protein
MGSAARIARAAQFHAGSVHLREDAPWIGDLAAMRRFGSPKECCLSGAECHRQALQRNQYIMAAFKC